MQNTTIESISKRNCFSRKGIFIAGLFLLLISSSHAYSQQHYHFQVQGVDNPGSAKQITDVIRRLFNTAEEPFRTFPAFDDESDAFDFECKIVVTQEELTEALRREGYLLLSFSAQAPVINNDRKL